MNNFTIDMAVKSENLNSNSILRIFKHKMMLKVMGIKSKEPRLTQKQICNQLGYSDSTIKRFRDDIQMDSPYKRSKYRKKTQSQTQTTNESPTINENAKSNKKNNTLKGGNPNDVHMTGKEIFEQAFQDEKVNSILENKDHQEDNTKFNTIARRMVDNV